MNRPIRVAMVGDYNPAFVNHTTADDSLGHASVALGIPFEFEWLPTPAISESDP